METTRELRFEELESMETPDFWTWYAAVKLGIVGGIIGAIVMT